MNTIGRLFRVTTFGESHGKALGCIVDGCPPGIRLSEKDVQDELDKRRPGQSKLTTSRSESDTVEILSGIFEGMSTGTPIAMVVRNHDADPSKYDIIRDTPRPGHADLTYRMKYKHVDHRGGGRASARETLGRVAAGAVAKKALERISIKTFAYTKSIGRIASEKTASHDMASLRRIIDSNPVKAIDEGIASRMEDEIIKAKKENDSVGGVVESVTFGLMPGVGEPVFGKLSSELAGALAGIPAFRGLEFGLGFDAARVLGSESNDDFLFRDKSIVTGTNNCGGMLGGISNGMPLVVRVAFKPTASIKKPQRTIDMKAKKEAKICIEGRHDPCVVPRAVAVVEAMINIVLMDMVLVAGLYGGDSPKE